MQKGFVIDTNKYSGNFEREMCAYLTGHTGDCGVGDKEKAEYFELFPVAVAGVAQIQEEEYEIDFERPCGIYPTENLWNNGMGFHYKEGEEELALQKWKESMVAYKEKSIKMYQSYYTTLPHTWTVESLDRHIKCLRQEIEEVSSETVVGKYAAYQSVIIHFHENPSLEAVEIMKARAYAYALLGREKDLEITGFRIVGFNN